MRQRLYTMRTLILAMLCISMASSILSAQVSPVQIEGIRRKSVIAQADIDTIRAFVGEQLNLLLTTEAGNDLDDITRGLVTNSISINTAIRDAYSDAFCEALRDSYKQILDKTSQLPDDSAKARVQIQVVITLALSDNVLLADDLLEQLASPNSEIRYWAVSAFLQPRIQNYTRNTTTEAQEVVRRVAGRMLQAAENETSPLILTRMAIFAVNSIKIGEANDLFKKCVQKRLAAYQNWTVDNEQCDWELMQTIFEVVRSRRLQDFKERETSVMRSAAELYTAAFERFNRGARYTVNDNQTISLLDLESEASLMTILIEGEKNLLILTGNRRGPRVANEISKTRWTAFPSIVSTLTGPTGDIQQVYSIYTPDEISKNTPLVKIDDPSQEVINAGMNRLQIRNKLLLPGVNN